MKLETPLFCSHCRCVPMLRGVLFSSLLGFQLLAAPAQGQPGDGPDRQKEGESGEFGLAEVRRRVVDSLFDTELPFTGSESAWDFRVYPKISDWVDEDYARLPYEFRYNFTEQTQGMIGHTPFFNNPFASHPQSSLGYFNLGIKHALQSRGDRWQMAVGAKARFPMEEIPADPWEVRANYAEYQPYVSLSRRASPGSRWHQVLNLRYQWVDESPFSVDLPPGPRPNSLFGLRPGLIYRPPGEWHYSLEFEYLTERLDGGSEDAFLIAPGVTWLPNRGRRNFPIPGDLEIALSVGYAIEQLPESELSSDIKVAVRLRWRLDAQSKRRVKEYLTGESSDG